MTFFQIVRDTLATARQSGGGPFCLNDVIVSSLIAACGRHDTGIAEMIKDQDVSSGDTANELFWGRTLSQFGMDSITMTEFLHAVEERLSAHAGRSISLDLELASPDLTLLDLRTHLKGLLEQPREACELRQAVAG